MLVHLSVLAIAFSSAAGARLQDTSETRASCIAFARWLEGAAPESNPRALIGKYRDALVRSGESASEVDRTMRHVWRCAFRDRNTLRLVWNRVYEGDDPIFVDAPNQLLVEVAQARPPGSALDVGMGQGRNAIYLALAGWRVTGFDPSDEGIRVALDAAEAASIQIDTAIATDDEFDFGEERWDLIVVTYVKPLDVEDAKRIERALKPGGVLVYENAAAEDNALLLAFANFRILRFEDILDYPDWNPDEKMRLHRLVAQRR